MAKFQAKTATPEINLSELFKSSSGDDEWRRFLIYGAKGAGKTTLAASVSAKFPVDLPAPERVVLDDIIYISADDAGMVSFPYQNIEIPNTIYFNKLRKEKKLDPIKAMDFVFLACKQAVEAGGIRAVVVDSLSSIDEQFIAHMQDDKYAIKASNGKINVRDTWMWLQREHALVRQNFNELSCHVIYVAHPKVNSAEFSDEKLDKAKAKVNSAPGANVIVPQITGASSEMYSRHTSVCALTTKRTPKGLTRVLLIGPNADYATKNRYPALPDTIEQPRLNTIFNQLDKVTRHGND